MRSIYFLLLGVFAVPASLAAQSPPALSLMETSVSASGVTPGGSVAWFSVARVREDLAIRVVSRAEVVADEDGDGVVRLELGGAVPLKSVWVAVDLASGGATAAAPEGSPLVEGDFLTKGVGGELLITRRLVHLFRARTGEEETGAWAERAGDGGPQDEDGEGDGLLHAGLSGLANAQGSAAAVPAELTGADVVVVIDPSRLDYQIVRGGA